MTVKTSQKCPCVHSWFNSQKQSVATRRVNPNNLTYLPHLPQTNETKEVLQLHYTRWPDFGVPKSPEAFLKFLHHVRQTGTLADNVGPPVIHCSAGIGRSGTFCLVDTCLVLVSIDHVIRDITFSKKKEHLVFEGM